METQLTPPLTKKERKELKRKQRLAQQERRQKIETLKKSLIFIIVGVLILVFFAFLFNSNFKKNEGNVIAIIEPNTQDHIKGNKDSKVVLIEYSDFQCPACAAYYPIIKQLVDEYKEKIAFIYRHFPLRQIHQNAQLAAQAAVAAGMQNHFWEMHDIIFERQKNWSDAKNAKDLFIKYAEELSLNIEQFKSDIDSKLTKDKVNSDYDGGLKLKVNGTPTFFLNGEKLNLPLPLEKFKELIDKKLNEITEK